MKQKADSVVAMLNQYKGYIQPFRMQVEVTSPPIHGYEVTARLTQTNKWSDFYGIGIGGGSGGCCSFDYFIYNNNDLMDAGIRLPFHSKFTHGIIKIF